MAPYTPTIAAGKKFNSADNCFCTTKQGACTGSVACQLVNSAAQLTNTGSINSSDRTNTGSINSPVSTNTGSINSASVSTNTGSVNSPVSTNTGSVNSASVSTNTGSINSPVNTNTGSVNSPVSTNTGSVNSPVSTNTGSVNSAPVSTNTGSVSSPVSTNTGSINSPVSTNTGSVNTAPVNTNTESVNSPACTGSGSCHPPPPPQLWIFGYGSLIWKPKFEYETCKIGKVNGYKRRFWQGNTYHRGTVESPAAVATLVTSPGDETWGVGFRVIGGEQIRAALDHVIGREVVHGGYCVTSVVFHPHHDDDDVTHRALVFYAEPDNKLYLAERNIWSLAKLITTSSGRCGNNKQYLFNLVEAIKKDFPPQALDCHLKELDFACRKIISESATEAG